METGSLTENLCSEATSSKTLEYQLRCEVFAHGLIAPSAKVRFLLGMTKFGSTSNFLPKPWQSEQAPWGELNEKIRGWISGRLIEQSGQAKCSENIVFLSFLMLIGRLELFTVLMLFAPSFWRK